MSAQTSVATVRSISTVAKRLFRRPNWIGVKAKLNTRLSTNGSATILDICFLYHKKKTTPKLIAMMIYKTLHTGQNSQEGGAKNGLASSE